MKTKFDALNALHAKPCSPQKEHALAEWSAAFQGRQFEVYPRGWQPLWPRPFTDPDHDDD